MFRQMFVSGGGPEEPQKYVIINQSSGKFFEVYGYDAFIFNYLFDYKIIQAGKTYKCGFPDSSLVKVTDKLNDLKISYQVIYRGKNPHVKDYSKINQYSKYKLIALQKIDIKERIDTLIEKIKLLDNEKAKEIMEKIEQCLE